MTPRLHLFDPLALRGLTLRNRIVVSPMCQYSADDGQATDWHLVHWASCSSRAPACSASRPPRSRRTGRITPGCLGLWDDATEQALGDRLARARRQAPAMPVAMQLAHAGRKARRRGPGQAAR